MYDDDDELAKQLREKSETKAILEDISDGNEEENGGNQRTVYNGSTVLSFHSNV